MVQPLCRSICFSQAFIRCKMSFAFAKMNSCMKLIEKRKEPRDLTRDELVKI